MSALLSSVRLLAALAAAALTACGAEPASPPAPAAAAEPGARAPAEAAADPLGARPPTPDPAPFVPPVPVVWKRANGLTVWLLERRALPLVSLQFVMRAGSAADPQGQGGLAYQTAEMLDEGAGARGSLEISRDIDRLGAELDIDVRQDYAVVGLSSLTVNLPAAAAIFGDIVSKPRFSPAEWKRVHELWENDLRARQSDPMQVARIVIGREVYGSSHPYGHPADGTLKSAAKVALGDVVKFYGEQWRADRATLVAVGDISRAELDPLLDRVLADLKSGAGAAAPAVREAGFAGLKRRVVLVDRDDAPQSVIIVARPGVAAGDVHPQLSRANAALGGSFTSRLNQDLREDHGWTYGSGSRFSFTEMPGLFAATAPVQTEHTGEALQAMLADIDRFAKQGLSDSEFQKTQLLARADLLEQFESVRGAAQRLAGDAGVGQSADYAAKASERIYAATKQDLDRLVAQHTDPANATIVIVGPRAKILPQLEAIGIGSGSVESSGAEGE